MRTSRLKMMEVNAVRHATGFRSKLQRFWMLPDVLLSCLRYRWPLGVAEGVY